MWTLGPGGTDEVHRGPHASAEGAAERDRGAVWRDTAWMSADVIDLVEVRDGG